MYRDQKITDFMSRDVLTVDVNEKVEVALARMKARGVSKILVVDGSVPQGILELWMAQKLEPAVTVRGALAQHRLDLSPVRQVSTEATFADARESLGAVSAVVVVDTPGNPRGLLGIVTPTDLYKARPKF